jgi:hypothetical protein
MCVALVTAFAVGVAPWANTKIFWRKCTCHSLQLLLLIPFVVSNYYFSENPTVRKSMTMRTRTASIPDWYADEQKKQIRVYDKRKIILKNK